MSEIERPVRVSNAPMEWGSDPIAALLRDMRFDYIALTPGASYRGLHDSLVNYLGNADPQMLLCVNEENAVAIAHGYAKVKEKPMAVAVHSNVGLMKATMAIFNAFGDRAPMLIVGAHGPVDAPKRRPWLDWLHSGRDLGSLVRGYVKWDDEPASPQAAVESLLRARMISTTAPFGPTYVCLDAGWQEQQLNGPFAMPDPSRYEATEFPAAPPPAAIARAVDMVANAKRPVIFIGRVTRNPDAWKARIALAEALNARVITDRRIAIGFPGNHRLQPYSPGPALDAAAKQTVQEADVILSLDFVDLVGPFRQAWPDGPPKAKVIHVSVDQYVHGGWSLGYCGLPEVDLRMLSTPDATVPLLLEELRKRAAPVRSEWPETKPMTPKPTAKAETKPGGLPGLSMTELAEGTWAVLKDLNPCVIRLPIGWPIDRYPSEHPMSYLGIDGGGGLGSGPGMAVGAALALRETKHFPVSIMGDGEFVMGHTAVWSAVHYGIPTLIIVANNRSFFNDEEHQKHVAEKRKRPVENKWIGLRMDGPPIDLAGLARSQGAEGFGPITSLEKLKEATAEAARLVRSGKVCVIDVHTQR